MNMANLTIPDVGMFVISAIFSELIIIAPGMKNAMMLNILNLMLVIISLQLIPLCFSFDFMCFLPSIARRPSR